MNRQAKSCYLKSNDKALKTVYLPHKKSIIVGRSPETNITDTLCSRHQGLLPIVLIHSFIVPY